VLLTYMLCCVENSRNQQAFGKLIFVHQGKLQEVELKLWMSPTSQQLPYAWVRTSHDAVERPRETGLRGALCDSQFTHNGGDLCCEIVLTARLLKPGLIAFSVMFSKTSHLLEFLATMLKRKKKVTHLNAELRSVSGKHICRNTLCAQILELCDGVN